MTKRIKIIGKKQPLVRDTSKPAVRIDPEVVAKALGAERVGSFPTNLPPPAMLELHRRLFLALRSSGGRPGLAGTELRPKIPMTVEDWNQLEQLARDLANEQGFAPTPGQVGSQILHEALARLRADANRVPATAPTATRASEPPGAYAVRAEVVSSRPQAADSVTTHSNPREAARRHLQQAQEKSEKRAA